ncbi:hypothetical protein GOBAR_AA16689 [Gossypium barbadense]|uniref:Uncharacterized protein n=1 Tax=Gossypium barbadense TaxID=3634 RepID=A0A2P5XL15_GOSBA|nr:hypothetical protein GOBAR_AA16689 [Gossypium barbadense]
MGIEPILQLLQHAFRLSLELEDNALRAARFSDCIHAMDIFRAFGWMLPAIAISLLLGTGPNAFIMALAVPLGQSALSLVFDKVSGRTSESWKSAPRRKTKKKQFTRAAANNTRTNKGKQEPNKTGGEKESYSSWLNTDGGLQDKGGQRVPKYGGWDQLDDQVETQKRATSRKGNGAPKQRKEDKFSRVPVLIFLLPENTWTSLTERKMNLHCCCLGTVHTGHEKKPVQCDATNQVPVWCWKRY